MRITCRFKHARGARVASRILVAALIWTGLLPGPGLGIVEASDVVPPEPAPVRPAIVGFADTHVHQFSNLGFGGLEVWGSPVDPTFDAGQFLANPDAARKRALPNSDYAYLGTLQAIDYLGIGEIPAITTPLAQMCDNGQCWPECPAGTGVQGNACWRIEIHGQNGGSDLLNKLIAHTPDHGTMGFPDMIGWPAYNVVTAQQVYWEWLKRAHTHGLKLMSMLAVNNQVLCHVAVHRASFGCDDDSSVDRQIQGAKDLEAYIDSIEGGPGQGFYRIVYSAAEARAAINAGKLAVVLGVEVDTPWGCQLNGSCTAASVAEEVQDYYDKGIRVVYPVHLLDNQFGGTALYDGLFEVANVLVNGGAFFDITTQCTPGLQWRSDIRQTIASAKDGVTASVVAIVALGVLGPLLFPVVAPLVGALTALLGPITAALPAVSLFVPLLGPVLTVINPNTAPLLAALTVVGGLFLPVAAVVGTTYLAIFIMEAPGPVGVAPAANCNSRRLTPLGETLITELMDHQMMIDVDHTDAVTLEDIMQLAEARKYPGIVSGHTGLLGAATTAAEAMVVLAPRGEAFDAGTTGRHEGVKTDAMVQRIVNLGGSVSLALAQGGRSKIRDFSTSDNVPFDCGGSSQTFAQVYLYATKTLGLSAVSFGSDLNGFSTWPVPRYGSHACGNQPGHLGDFGPGYNPSAGQLNYANLTDYFGAPLDKYQFGTHTWDYNTEGFAHVGLYPDFIADLQANGLTAADLAPLFNGVEAYVRMWEKVDDVAAPTVRCGTVGDDWHDADVSVPCIAFDTGFELADAGDASFVLSTSVPAGSETGDAATGTHDAICDKAGHCTAVVASIAGINVDKKDPGIVVATPAAGTPAYTVGQVVTADYSCTDFGSGVATCAGPVASGGTLVTTAGAHAFTVNATDQVGHAAAVAHPYVVGYAVCALYDPAVTKKAGSTVPIKVRLCDATGANLSSPSLVLHATGVTRTSSNTPAALEDAGNANPDFDFRYDAGIAGYIFNLSTKGYGAGSYVLNFTASGDPTVHTAAFAVR